MSAAHLLNRRQIAWLRLHALSPGPHRWAWVNRDGSSSGALDDRHYLRAWRMNCGLPKQATIHEGDRAGLEPFMSPASFRVNEAGFALLEGLK